MAYNRSMFTHVLDHAGDTVFAKDLAADPGIFLDAIGPLSIWYLAVLIIGAAALSGAKRKSVAFAIGGLYLVLMIFFSALGGMFSRGGGAG